MDAYWRRKDELSLELGCVMWGARVVIPTKLRQFMLNTLHWTHPGASGMKSLARSYIWWPSMNNEIENMVRLCEVCNKHGRAKPSVGQHPWIKPQGPWQRVHMDFAGPFQGYMWLVLQCAYSKWPEVAKMKSTAAPRLIKELRDIFSRAGVPVVMVSDQGPQFTSDLLDQFMKKSNIRHILAPTYHPKSNGLAERLVGSFKHALSKMIEEEGDTDKNVADFLLRYRNTPHSITNTEPAVMMYGRTLRSSLHFIRPADKERAKVLQADREQTILDELPKVPQFKENEPVYVQVDGGKTWSKAVVKLRHGSSHVYDVMCHGRTIQKHVDHIKKRGEQPVQSEQPFLSSPHRLPDCSSPSSSSEQQFNSGQHCLPDGSFLPHSRDSIGQPPRVSRPFVDNSSRVPSFSPKVDQGTVMLSRPNIFQGTNNSRNVDQSTDSAIPNRSNLEHDTAIQTPNFVQNNSDKGHSLTLPGTSASPKTNEPADLRRSARIKAHTIKPKYV